MLSWSGRTQEVAVDLASLRVAVPHADALIALADAATLPDGAEGEGARARARARLSAAMGPRAMVDAAAVAANFEMMTRLADATGALLDRADRAEAGALAGADGFASRRDPDRPTHGG
jgi:hypothetical protein